MYIGELQPKKAISNDSYWKEFCDRTVIVLPDISEYFPRNINQLPLMLCLSKGPKIHIYLCWLDWICLTTTHVLQDILAVVHK